MNTIVKKVTFSLAFIVIVLMFFLNKDKMLVSWIEINKKNLAGRDMANFYWPVAKVSEADMERTILTGAELTHAKLSCANFQ